MNKKLILIFVAIVAVVGLVGLMWFIGTLIEPTPLIESISPSSGTVGTEVTIKGSDFHPKNNEILFDCKPDSVCFYGKLNGEIGPSRQNAIISDIPSPDGKTLTFTIPYVFNEELFLPIGEIWISVLHSGYASGPLRFNLESKGKTKIEEAKEKLLRELMTIKGVVGGGIGECKIEWGVHGRVYVLCIKIYLEKDSPELRKKIPSQFEGFKVDIEVTGPIEALPR